MSSTYPEEGAAYVLLKREVQDQDSKEVIRALNNQEERTNDLNWKDGTP